MPRNGPKANRATLLLCEAEVQKIHKHELRHTLTLLPLRVGEREKGLTFID